MQRITHKQLDGLANRIRRLMGAVEGPAWTRRADGSNCATVGYVFWSPGGSGVTWKLCQMVNEGGAESTILMACSARELYEIMGAYAQGLQYAADRQHDSELAANWNLPS